MSSSTSVAREGTTSPPTEVKAIDPGSIVQEDLPPATVSDGSSYDRQFAPTHTVSVSTISGVSNKSGGDGSGGQLDIEVSSTIQTILVTLGICIAVLFLLGVIATHYITHKNKKAEEKKKTSGTSGDEKGPAMSGGGGGMMEKSNAGNKLRHGPADDDKSDMVTVMIDEKDSGILKNSGNGSGNSTPVHHSFLGLSKSLRRNHSNSVSSNNPPAGLSHSPKSGGIIGGIGTAVGGSGHSGTGSFQIGGSGSLSVVNLNPREPYMDVAQVYTRRGSITPTPPSPTLPSQPSPPNSLPTMPLRTAGPGYSQKEHPHPGGLPPDLQIGIFPSSQDSHHSMMAYHHPYPHDLSSPMFAISPSSAVTDSPDRNPFNSPPLSADSKSSLMLDPFRTQNNSQLSLNMMMSGPNTGTPGGDGHDEDRDSYPFPSQVNAPKSNLGALPHSTPNTLSRSMSALPLRSISSSPATISPARTLDDLTEPKHVLRQLQSGIPAYHRHTMMPTTMGPSTAINGIGSSGNAAAATARPTVERQASFSPGAHDRRSLAGSVVTAGNERNSTGGSSINEGNAWYRKRASVIIPDGGTAHVRLWKDDGETTEIGSGIVNRSGRSGSQSSAQSQSSTSSGTATPSPLRLNRLKKEAEEEENKESSMMTVKKPSSLQLEPVQEKMSVEDGLSPRTPRNGAAVFEGLQTKGSISRTPSPTILSPPVLVEPERCVVVSGVREGMLSSVGEEQEQESPEGAIVRLRTPRRGNSSNSLNRQSYLDDYREQQKQQL
ncbi:hypothetical protein BGZ72_010053 [Mortierella alpina]|nr:hypothetical protein BGZ72_010011 [Mortierella alpina]KAF9962163.1 hypothetical protein BGZ72_010053 [Mortierella alpina]